MPCDTPHEVGLAVSDRAPSKNLLVGSPRMRFARSTQPGSLMQITEVTLLADWFHAEDLRAAQPSHDDLPRHPHHLHRATENHQAVAAFHSDPFGLDILRALSSLGR